MFLGKKSERIFRKDNSNVFESIDKDGHITIIKRGKYIRIEQEIMRYLGRNPRIVNVKSFNEGEIVLERATCDLKDFILDCSLDYTKKIIKSVLKALDFCHSKNIVHGDIKPENILIFKKGKDIRAKLCDFGLSIKLFPQAHNPHGSLGNNVLQTPYYRAPELMIPRNLCADFMKRPTKIDLWSVGVVMTECLGKSLYPPDFSGSEEEIHCFLLSKLIGENLPYHELVNRIVDFKDKNLVGKLNVKKNYDNLVDRNGQKLLKMLLKFNPNDRITAKGALSLKFLSFKK